MNNKIIIIMFGVLITSSCVSNSLQPEVVSRTDAQKQQYVVFGVINNVNNVLIEGDREIGAAAGAVIGGKIGKDVTDSEVEENIATVLGAIIGSSIGSEIAAAKKEGVELLIETDSGNFISIIQEVGAYSFFKGQKVQIIKRNGKSRVIPFE
jgi:outer membrane lipoprotein SlyB|tara:strand:- start:599 stop:1054 length:456 start_codon:yes stop_codon:yes gene_type:complete